MKNLNNLRDMLFDTLEKLKNNEIEVDKAKAINEMAQTIINTGKLEHDYLKLIVDNNKKLEKPAPVVSYFINQEPIDITLKKIEENNQKPYEYGK